MKIPAVGASTAVQPLSPSRPATSDAVAQQTRVDTTDKVELSNEAKSILKNEDKFVSQVRSIVAESTAAREADLARDAAVRERAQLNGEAPGQAMNAKTGDQSSSARRAPGRSIRLVRR